MSQVTITVINPFSGAIVERDASAYTQRDCELFASRLSDEEAYQCEGGDTPAEWVANMVTLLGAKRAGAVILS